MLAPLRFIWKWAVVVPIQVLNRLIFNKHHTQEMYAQNAFGFGDAFNPEVQVTARNLQVAPQTAHGAGGAFGGQLSYDTSVPAETAQGRGDAWTASTARQTVVRPVVAQGAGQVQAAQVQAAQSVSVHPQVAAGAGAAFSALIQDSGNAVPTPATGVGVAHNAKVSTLISVAPPSAVGLGVAMGATTKTQVTVHPATANGAGLAGNVAKAASAPAPPTLSGVAGDGLNTLSWNTPPNNGATISSYLLIRNFGQADALGIPVGNVNTYPDDTAQNDTTYTYTVVAQNSAGDSPGSNIVTLTPRAPGTVPAAPNLTSAVASPGQVTLQWTPSTNDGGSPLIDFVVRRDGTVVGLFLGGSATSWTDNTGLAASTTYSYTVAAKNKIGEGPESNARSATTPAATGLPAIPPDIPSGLAANRWVSFRDLDITNPTLTSVWHTTRKIGGSSDRSYTPFLYGYGGGYRWVGSSAKVAPYNLQGAYGPQRTAEDRAASYSANNVKRFVHVRAVRGGNNNTYPAGMLRTVTQDGQTFQIGPFIWALPDGTGNPLWDATVRDDIVARLTDQMDFIKFINGKYPGLYDGVLWDMEDFQSNTWRWDYTESPNTANTHSKLATLQAAWDWGLQIGNAYAAAYPGYNFNYYGQTLPGGYMEMDLKKVYGDALFPNTPLHVGGAPGLAAYIVAGIIAAGGYGCVRHWDAYFYKGVEGFGSFNTAMKLDTQGQKEWLSKYGGRPTATNPLGAPMAQADWDYAASRFCPIPFIWPDEHWWNYGDHLPPNDSTFRFWNGGREGSSYDRGEPAVANHIANFRKWAPVLDGERWWGMFVFDGDHGQINVPFHRGYVVRQSTGDTDWKGITPSSINGVGTTDETAIAWWNQNHPGDPLADGYTFAGKNPPGGHEPGIIAGVAPGTVDSSAFTIGAINQSRSGSVVTITTTARHAMGILNCHYTLYGANGTTVISQGEARLSWNWAGHDRNTGWDEPNLDFTFFDCTYTITGAAGLYVILDFYSTKGQRTSRKVQLV